MTPDQISGLITQAGISAIFILAWFNERSERQKIQANKDIEMAKIQAEKDKIIAEAHAQMMAMQTQHRAEIMEITRQMFGQWETIPNTAYRPPLQPPVLEK